MTRDVRSLRLNEFIADGLYIDQGGNGYPGYGAVRVSFGNGNATPLVIDGAAVALDGDLSVGGRIIGLLDCLSNAVPAGASASGSPGASTNVARYDHQHPYQPIAISGDATASGTTALALTLATVNANVGSFGDAATVPVFTVNAKGLVTAASAVAITPASIGGVPAGRQITLTGSGLLTGGGDLSADRNIDLAQQGQNTVIGRTAAGSGPLSALSAPMIGVVTAADAAASRAALGLGSAAVKSAGTLSGNVLLLSADNTLPALSGAALTGVAAVPASSVVTTGVNLTLDATYNGKAVNCTAAITITLPAASGLLAGWNVIIKPTGGDVTIQRTGADTIDAATAIIQPKIAWGSAARSVTIMVASSSSFISL